MTALLLKKVSPVTVRDQLTTHLREAVLRGQLRPGQRLVERAIAESTGTSQTSVREALQVLEHEGLVTKKTNAAGCAKSSASGSSSNPTPSCSPAGA